jgi:hypothetical protein
MIPPPELSENSTSSHLVANEEKLAKDMMNLTLRSIFVYTSKGSSTRRKILRHGADANFPEGRQAADLYRH